MKAVRLLFSVRAPGLLLALLLGACAAHGLRCDQALQPINPPAPDAVPPHPRSDHAQ
jgi:hypothetical protein